MRLLMLAFAVLAMSPRAADGCSCRPAPDPCEAAWTVPYVFTGTVQHIQVEPTLRSVTFRVERVWRHDRPGEPLPDTLTIATGRDPGGGDCGYPFERGRAYVVYAERGGIYKAPLTTTICTRTRPVEDAAGDLAYLAGVESGAHASRVFGHVLLPDEHGGWRRFPFAPLELHRDDDVWTGEADGDGFFEFVNLPPARYYVFVRDHLVAGEIPAARIEHPSACARVDLRVRPPRP